MNKKKYIVPNVVVRTPRLLVSPIMQSGPMKMKSTSGFFPSGITGNCAEPIFGSGGFNFGENDYNDDSFGGSFGHGLWN